MLPVWVYGFLLLEVVRRVCSKQCTIENNTRSKQSYRKPSLQGVIVMGRDRKNEKGTEQYTKMIRSLMQTEAWRALSTTAQALYPWIRMEWRGPKSNQNGSLHLSTRQAADRMGVNHKTAARAFQELQAKGFLYQTQGACLGVEGHGKAPAYEITELPLPGSQTGRRLYNQWTPGQDFEVQKAQINRRKGSNQKR